MIDRISSLLIGLALRAHERPARERFGAEMRRIHESDVAAARERGAWSAFIAAVRGACDVAATGLRERLRGEAPSGTAQRAGSGESRIDRLRLDMRFAFRSLLRQPAFTLVAVVTLGLGIGATTATFSVVNGVLLRSLPYPDAGSLVQLWQTSRRSPGGPVGGSVSPVVFEDWRERTSSFESMAAWARSSPTLTGLGEPEVLTGAIVTPDFFRVFRREPALGRSFAPGEAVSGGPQVVVISWGFWQERLGGTPEVIGRTIELRGRPWEIVGVAPAGFDYPVGSSVWMPLQNSPSCDRGCVFLDAVARLGPTVTASSALQQLAGVSDVLSVEFPGDLANSMGTLESLHATIVGDVGRALWLLLGAVGLVLLIACANVANLMIARGAARADEIAVRAALGAGRGRIVAQLLTESLMLAFAGGALGLALAGWGVRALRSLSAEGLPRIDEVGIDANVLIFTLAAALFTALLFGLVPALQLARGPVADTLRRGSGRTAGGGQGIGRSVLLAAETGLSLLLLVGAGLLVRSFVSLQRVDPGFRVDGVSQFSVSLPSAKYDSPARVDAFFDELQDRLRAMPGVTGVGRTLFPPLSGSAVATTLLRTDRPAPEAGTVPVAGLFTVDDGFFDVFGIPIVAGRSFEPSDRHGSVPVAIINRTMADRYFPGEDAIGRSITTDVAFGYSEAEPRRIIGIAADVRTEELTDEPQPELYVPFAQSVPPYATMLIHSVNRSAGFAADVRSVVRSLDPDLPIRNAGTMREIVARQTARPRFYLLLLTLFAGLALVLAAVGLYGVVAYLVTQRRREIGVRMVLGANSASIVGLVLRQGMRPALLGALAGLATALAAVRIMGSLLFEVEPLDPATFIGTTLLLLVVVLLACLVPAGKASRIPPASALRSGG